MKQTVRKPGGDCITGRIFQSGHTPSVKRRFSLMQLGVYRRSILSWSSYCFLVHCYWFTSPRMQIYCFPCTATSYARNIPPSPTLTFQRSFWFSLFSTGWMFQLFIVRWLLSVLTSRRRKEMDHRHRVLQIFRRKEFSVSYCCSEEIDTWFHWEQSGSVQAGV